MKPKPDATIVLKPKLPFDFDLSSKTYNTNKYQTHGAYIDKTLYKCLQIDEETSLITITEHNNELLANLHGNNLERLEETAKWIISAELDLAPFYKTDDKPMRTLIESNYGLKPSRTASIYEALIIAITEQQISLNVAYKIQDRLAKKYGSKYEFGPHTFYSFPTPDIISNVEIMDLRQLGLSRNKASYIIDISKKIASDGFDLESLKYVSTDEVREVMLSLRGVGPWTANYVLIRGLGRTNMVPYDDLGLRDSVGYYYRDGERVSSDEAEEIFSRFGDYKGIACFYLLFARVFLEKIKDLQ